MEMYARQPNPTTICRSGSFTSDAVRCVAVPRGECCAIFSPQHAAVCRNIPQHAVCVNIRLHRAAPDGTAQVCNAPGVKEPLVGGVMIG